MTVIGRYDRPDGRWYVDPLDHETQYLSVTTVLSGTVSKPWLAAWEAGLAAEFAVDNLDLLRTVLDSDAGRAGAVDLVKGAGKRAKDVKADVGSYVHDVIEALILDATIPSIPEHLEGRVITYSGPDDRVTIDQDWLDSIIMGFLNFHEDFAPEYEMAEATVVHPEHGWAGTLDAVLRLGAVAGNPRALVDYKTGKVVDKDAGKQLSAYRRARVVWLDSMGNRIRMPQVDKCLIVHLRTTYERGYKVLEQDATDQDYEDFLARLEQYRRMQAAPKITGRPLYPSLPDGSQPLPLIEDLDVDGGFNRYRGPLSRRGIRNLADLAALDLDGLLAVPYVGKSAVEPVRALLAQYGLTLAGEEPPATETPTVAAPDLLTTMEVA